MKLLYSALASTLLFSSCARKRDAMCRCCAAWGDCADRHLVQDKTADEAREICARYNTTTLFCDINKVKEE